MGSLRMIDQRQQGLLLRTPTSFQSLTHQLIDTLSDGLLGAYLGDADCKGSANESYPSDRYSRAQR